MPGVNGAMQNTLGIRKHVPAMPPTTTTSNAERIAVNGIDRRTTRLHPIQEVSSTHNADTCS